MILPPKDPNAHLASAWTAGMASLFLVIGLSGAVTPLLPEQPAAPRLPETVEVVLLEEFAALQPEPAPLAAAEPSDSLPAEDSEIPPVPEITPPLIVPEMLEITPLEAPAAKPRPPALKPAPAKPRSPGIAAPAPKTPPAPAVSKPGGPVQNAAKPGGQNPGAQQVSPPGAGGKGRFPQPGYPAAARRAGLEGSVRLSVNVEAGGLPGFVSVVSSSGHAILDAAARDQVLRRWRWPAGTVRQFIIPIRFVLK